MHSNIYTYRSSEQLSSTKFSLLRHYSYRYSTPLQANWKNRHQIRYPNTSTSDEVNNRKIPPLNRQLPVLWIQYAVTSYLPSGKPPQQPAHNNRLCYRNDATPSSYALYYAMPMPTGYFLPSMHKSTHFAEINRVHHNKVHDINKQFRDDHQQPLPTIVLPFAQLIPTNDNRRLLNFPHYQPDGNCHPSVTERLSFPSLLQQMMTLGKKQRVM